MTQYYAVVNSTEEHNIQNSLNTTVAVPLFSHQHDQRHFKHSVRQVNHLFQNHPTRLRDVNPLIEATEEESIVNNNCTYQFPSVYSPPHGMLPNGWVAPPSLSPSSSSSDFVMQDYSFHIQRTKNKPNNSVGFLPIYLDSW